MKYLSAILLCVLAACVSVEAQQGASGTARVSTEIFASSISNSVVKGAPFSAEAISESVQTLSDGNKIVHSNTTRMFRDSEGRYRREGDSTAGSGFSFSYSDAVSTFGFQDAISISDPVANVRYSLNPANKTARRMNALPRLGEGTFVFSGQTLSPAMKAQIETATVKKAQTAAVPALPTMVVGGDNVFATTIVTGKGFNAGKTESLGTREFDGVTAEGTRTVTTIPAGTIGNERPIDSVYERWYSKELQLIVYSVRSDPRFGEQVYRLANISRSEPDRSLFVPPADYKIVTEPAFNIVAPAKPQ
jgi:hypothetical protein